jgi:uncharacterized protein YbgA (DUF1722 family)/uncharacterized protein YbbK (DUF523 family)
MGTEGKRVFTTPRLVVSRCLEFDAVRYDGSRISSPFVALLREHAECIPVCPEVEIGLGIPRESVRIVRVGGEDRLIQPATGKDVTEPMHRFIAGFLDGLPDVEGFVLKHRSPTSGLGGVNVYPSAGKSAAIERTAGFFGREVIRRYPFHPKEDEGRLRDHRIRDHFLTRIYTLADFRQVKALGTMDALVRFHTRQKLLLKAHSAGKMRDLGQIVANRENRPVAEVMARYGPILLQVLSRAPRIGTNLDILQHALGYVSHGLAPQEKAFFLENLEAYRAGRVSLAVPKNLLKAWILRFDAGYLKAQAYFAPYPDDLMEAAHWETDLGRDLWKDREKEPGD